MLASTPSMPTTRWASRRIPETSLWPPQSFTNLASGALSEAGIEVVARVPCEAVPTPDSLSYLRTKKERMGHALTLGRLEHPGSSPDPHDEFEFASVEAASRELRAGRMIVVVDDEDRENEGDLTMAAELVTPEAINFM